MGHMNPSRVLSVLIIVFFASSLSGCSQAGQSSRVVTPAENQGASGLGEVKLQERHGLGSLNRPQRATESQLLNGLKQETRR